MLWVGIPIELPYYGYTVNNMVFGLWYFNFQLPLTPQSWNLDVGCSKLDLLLSFISGSEDAHVSTYWHLLQVTRITKVYDLVYILVTVT